jgi:hypothetical protein
MFSPQRQYNTLILYLLLACDDYMFLACSVHDFFIDHARRKIFRWWYSILF